MDYSKISYSEKICDILDPVTDEETGIKITLVCSEDDKVQKFLRKYNDEKNRLAMKGKTLSTEEEWDNDVKFIQTAITGWSWGRNPKTNEECLWRGEKPELNLKNLKDVLKNFPTFKKQILHAIREEKDFLQVSN